MQLRVRDLYPEPQVTLHCPHELQSSQVPSTGPEHQCIKSEKKVYNLQHVMSQLVLFFEGPLQSFPLHADGKVQVRVEDLYPEPQVTLHCPHGLHSSQVPSTGPEQ